MEFTTPPMGEWPTVDIPCRLCGEPVKFPYATSDGGPPNIDPAIITAAHTGCELAHQARVEFLNRDES